MFDDSMGSVLIPRDLKSRGTGSVYPGAGLNPHLVELYSQIKQTYTPHPIACLPQHS
jgi:hypothetical protein